MREDASRESLEAVARPGVTVREIDCLRLVAEGRTSAEIALAYAISENTVNHHLAAVCRKLDALNRTHAVTIALRLGLIE
ncbi:MAG: helix-turn-helix transcriptional regulator [Rhizobiaceae bacterium]|nr:helix-turn-helix transcriptional regulator [Rhizobiaceae bacterium]